MQVLAIENHFRENRQKLVKRMMFRSGSEEDAEDIVQEAYCRALKYIHSYNGEHLDKWFNTVLNNALREYKNMQNGHSTDIFEEEEAEGTACPHYSEHVMKEVYELIDTKSVIQQEVLNYYFKQEYSAVDISRITNYTYGQCHQIILRFRNELKELYGNQ
jgi:RNA polymerase sigma factor (sigma-70 family)